MIIFTCTSTRLVLLTVICPIQNLLNMVLASSATILVLVLNSLLGMVLVSLLVASLMYKELSKADFIVISLVKTLSTLSGMERVVQLVPRL